MIEYRHNQEWGTIFLKDINPRYLKQYIEDEVDEKNLGDIEVIDVQMTSVLSYEGAKHRTHDALVFYRPITTQTKSEVTVK